MPPAAFVAPGPLPPGWYRVRLDVHTPGRAAVRKHAVLAADAGGDSAPLDAFEWNAALREDLIVRLATPADNLRLTLRHPDPSAELARFDVRRVSPVRALARAVRLKLGLLAAYNCFWPVVRRGGRLLARGRFSEFGRRLFKGLSDSRTMRIEVKEAAEANAAWWRRRALPAAEAAALRAEAEAIADPRPVAVLIPADPTRIDHARHAALSVCLQIYPHWELVVLWPTRKVPAKLASAVRWESRAAAVGGDGLADAAAKALGTLKSLHVVVLPPEWELAEHALLRFAQTGANAATCRAPDADAAAPAMVPAETLRAALPSLPEGASAVAAVRWAAAVVPTDAVAVPEILAVPMNGGSAAGPTVRRQTAGPPLVLAADIRGISGWDYLAFCMLKGLRSLGTDVRKHPQAQVRADLVPPDLRPRELVRGPADAQLVVAPPFLVKRFAPDARTAVFTMWETDRLAPADAATLSRAGLVIVPTAWAAESFRASGVTAPLAVVPLGYDPLVFHPAGAANPAITFGTAGALSAGGLRKNVRRVIDLFRLAFPAEPDVRLRVKITPNCPPLDAPDDPRIEVLRAALPHADLAAWNRSLTCYVNASFAEGFGLHLLEAMACGRPLISTTYSGPSAFFDEGVGYVVPYRLVETRNEVYAGRWADPDDAAIVAAMRRVYADPTDAARRGEAAAARARRFTWRDCGRALAAVLRERGFLGNREH